MRVASEHASRHQIRHLWADAGLLGTTPSNSRAWAAKAKLFRNVSGFAVTFRLLISKARQLRVNLGPKRLFGQVKNRVQVVDAARNLD